MPDTNVTVKTQRVIVDPWSQGVTVISAGPIGPTGVQGPPGNSSFLNASTFNVAADGTDQTANMQGAISFLGGSRRKIVMPEGDILFTGASMLDVVRANLIGQGKQPNTGGGGTNLVFSGTGGIYSSVQDNTGYALSDMTISGAGAKVTNGQLLVDFSGQNVPRMSNVRIRNTDIALRLAKGATVECNYGVFDQVDIFSCTRAIDLGAGTIGANSHTFVGGRIWDCTVGALIDDTVNAIAFVGTAFECGAGNTAVDSSGYSILFVGVRFETLGTNLHIRLGAGEHRLNGCHHSSGIDIIDENEPGVVVGDSTVPEGMGLPAPSAGGNLVSNGRAQLLNGTKPSGWTDLYSTIGPGYTYSAQSGDATVGTFHRLSNLGATNPRFYQVVPVIKGVRHSVMFRARANVAGARVIVGDNAHSLATTHFIHQMPTTNVWRTYRYSFTPTTDVVNLAAYINGSGVGNLDVTDFTMTVGRFAAPAFVPKPITETSSEWLNNNTTLAAKADKTYVDAADALKASIDYVDAADALKANKTYVDAADALKSDKTYVDAADALKADKTYVDSQDIAAASFTETINKRHVWFTPDNVSGNYIQLPIGLSASDPSWKVRFETVIPPIDGQLRRPISSAPMYFGFDSVGNIIVQMNATDATIPSLYFYRTSFAAAGLPTSGTAQFEMKWDTTTDLLNISWRPSGTDLVNDVGWVELASISHTGKISNQVSSFRIGGPTVSDEWSGPIFRAVRWVNNVIDADVNPEVDFLTVVPDAVTFQPSVGPVATVNRAHPSNVRLVSNQVLVPGNTVQKAINGLAINVATALSQSSRELSGVGSPEGVVIASPGTEYLDTAGTNGALRWIKTTGTGATGWKVTTGDTGWRNIRSLYTPPAAIPSLSGEILIRRVNNIVMFGPKMLMHTESAAVAAGLWTFSPSSAGVGFRGNQGYFDVSLIRQNGLTTRGHMAVSNVLNFYGVYMTANWPASFPVGGEVHWVTSEAWPTTLPGVAV